MKIKIKKWEYGEIYKKYDMENIINLPNNSIIMACDWIKEMPEFIKKADTLFIDPPWNTGNMNTFYTKAGKEHLDFNFITFTEHLFIRIIEINPKFLFIEMGKQYMSHYIEKCKLLYKYVTFYNSTYYHSKKNKCYIIHATNIFKNKRYRELEDMDEELVIEWLCKNHEYNCIGDLCMGRGLVGKQAYLNNKSFVGIELNKKRLAILVDFIKQKSNGLD